MVQQSHNSASVVPIVPFNEIVIAMCSAELALSLSGWSGPERILAASYHHHVALCVAGMPAHRII